MTLRRTTQATILVALALVISSCTGDGTAAEPQPLPPVESSATASSTPAPTTTATTTKDPLDGYTTAEKDAYNAAVSTVERFLAVDARLTHKGKNTAAARRAYQTFYFGSYKAVSAWQTLALLDDSNSYFKGGYKLVEARPTRIATDSVDGDSVSLRVCLDGSSIRVFQRGTGEVDQPKRRGPTQASAVVSRFPDGLWKFSSFKRTERPC